jgi:hypothetical protein
MWFQISHFNSGQSDLPGLNGSTYQDSGPELLLQQSYLIIKLLNAQPCRNFLMSMFN